MRSRLVTIYIMMCSPLALLAQIGDYRNGLAIGFNGGYVLSNIGFNPNVSQTFHNGMSGGLTIRYVSEKYFKTICSIQGEINFTQAGWKENIVDVNKNKVINPITGQNEAYQRTINYLQIPIFAHLAWGREQKGVNFFVQAGPQVGLYLNESTSTNFNHRRQRQQHRGARHHGRRKKDRLRHRCRTGPGVLHPESWPLHARRALLLRTGRHLPKYKARLFRQIKHR